MSYEDVYIYLDLTKDILKKKDIIKNLKYYIDEKNKVNLKGHYSILIFQEEGNPVFITDKKDAEIIAKSIDENWKTRPRESSFFENGLFYIFSYIAETVRKKSKNNRVIVITDTPSDLNDDYQEALFNLVGKIKHFPTFIDIIRIADKGERFFKDDVKLNILASDTKGGHFLINNKKEFFDIFTKLVKNKQLSTIFADKPDQISINNDDYMFYSRLAKKLQPPQTIQTGGCFFCRDEICPVCTDINDITLICEDCGSGFHNCCVINYTITHNIGIPHIFRCPKCDILLKIDEDEIVDVAGEEGITSVKEYIGMEEYDDGPIIIDDDEFPASEPPAPSSYTNLHSSEPIPSSSLDEIPSDPSLLPQEGGEEIKQIRIGGFFGRQFSVRKSGDKIIYEKLTRSKGSQYQAEVTYTKKDTSSETPSLPQAKTKSRINICPVCGTPIPSSTLSKCNYCNSDLY